MNNIINQTYQNKTSYNGIVVCVTGASGYIASWIVQLLLQRGYVVHATVRDTSDIKKTQHLKALEGAKERLHLFKADLMEEGSFESAISGCHAVFHTASPVNFHTIKDPQSEVLDPAIKGTLSILSACKKCPTVRRIVLTSSMGAVVYNGRRRGPDVVVDETWFSDPDSFKDSKGFWYLLSKIMAEKAAWEYVRDNEMDMVSINPGSVLGPMLQPTLCESVATILSLIDGKNNTYQNVALPWVNVKDVAMAHILAFEVPSASGRYCLVETVVHQSQLVDLLRELFPSLPLPDRKGFYRQREYYVRYLKRRKQMINLSLQKHYLRCEDEKPLAPTYQVSKERVTSLGMEHIPFKTSLKETVKDLKEKGFINF